MIIMSSKITVVIKGTSIIIAVKLFHQLLKLTFGPSSNDWTSKKDKKAEMERNRIKTMMLDPEYQLEKRKPQKIWNNVIFFPDETPTNPKSPTNKLIYFLSQARVSIQLCIYLVSHPWLVEVIKQKHFEGLLIQVITDYDTFTAHNNFGPKLWRRKGIEVRMNMQGTENLMHHKFVIIDEEAVVSGSLNWTKQGIAWNQENITISTNKNIVKKYVEEYNSLWAISRDF